ncbi:hypothetical protein EDD18DRAFT_1357424 [Armillaria luteobubalina]|uniref:Uncharacterized protein n=1 Tax=Armillaria luteobubalina TaxID=153913 RepID=A0AA39PZH1_9AGAR|nr:hypothetical protein EDD18DRAFT_1357424 [Armillaria luteobubalina]
MYEFYLPDGSISKNYVPKSSSFGSASLAPQITETAGKCEILDLKENKEWQSSKGVKSPPRTVIDSSVSDNGEACSTTVPNQTEVAGASPASTGAIDVSDLFDMSSANLVLGPAYMDQEDDSDDFALVSIFRARGSSPRAHTKTSSPSKRCDLHRRKRLSRHGRPPAPTKRRKRVHTESDSDGERAAGWEMAYGALLKRYSCLRKEYKSVSKDAQGRETSESDYAQGQSNTPVSTSASGADGEAGPSQPYRSNIFSLLS